NAHITAVHPVGPWGVFALGSLAELANAHLMVNELPIRNEEMARFATKEFLVENATASLNGCHLIVTTRDAAGSIIEDFKKHNFAPERIGIVAKKGVASIAFTEDISNAFFGKDRKSTRLNSSHVSISYAVFCLKKKIQLITFIYC